MEKSFTGVLKATARFENRSQLLAILRAPVRQAGGVGEDVSRCHPVSPWTGQRILLQILIERTIEIDRAVLGQLQHNAGEDWFPERRGGKERVRGDRRLC